MNLWESNLILSDIPWDYYLHPCPKFYAWELAKRGPTIWVNPSFKKSVQVSYFQAGAKSYRSNSMDIQATITRRRIRSSGSEVTNQVTCLDLSRGSQFNMVNFHSLLSSPRRFRFKLFNLLVW